MSVESFQSYWRDVHAPLIARTPGLRRYIQAHALPEMYDEQPPAYDGLAEAWFDSLQAFDAAVASAEWQAAVADAPNFIGKSVRMLATELPIIDAFAAAAARRGMVKYAGFLKRKQGLSVDPFQKHWREVHAPRVVAEIEGMRRYVRARRAASGRFPGRRTRPAAAVQHLPAGLPSPPTLSHGRSNGILFIQDYSTRQS
jgi:uncharacterized protein (TIGR02118 family)